MGVEGRFLIAIFARLIPAPSRPVSDGEVANPPDDAPYVSFALSL